MRLHIGYVRDFDWYACVINDGKYIGKDLTNYDTCQYDNPRLTAFCKTEREVIQRVKNKYSKVKRISRKAFEVKI
jgi:hypothetical protein